METLEKIDQLLKCAICLQRYDNPKITSCFHTFCDTCINKQFATKNTFICPVCSVENQQSSAFIENSLINTIVHILTEKDGGRRNCDLCDEEAADPAIARCAECAKYLCEHHVLNHKLAHLMNFKLKSFLEKLRTRNLTLSHH
jgi:tripartite motif-containing protein 2/3